MPSPIAHSVTGYVIAHLPVVQRYIPHRFWPRSPFIPLYALLVVNLPDLDFLPQLVTGLKFHRGPSHSIAAGLIISGLFAWLIVRLRPKLPFWGVFTLTFVLYASHLGMDLFTSGGSGIPLFWPLVTSDFSAPFSLFPPVHHSRGLWDTSHLVFITAEIAYATVLLYITSRLNRRSVAQYQASHSSHRQPPVL